MDISDRIDRVNRANELLIVIANTGRQFFEHKGLVSRLELDANGKLWFEDSYSKRRINMHKPGDWTGFTEGGTLQNVIAKLSTFILDDICLPASIFGPWPQWYCNGDPWGYGCDMIVVRDAAVRLNITHQTTRANNDLAQED